MTTEAAEPEAVEAVTYQSYLIIEWPAPRKPDPSPMPAWQLTLTDAVSGQQISTALRITVHADAEDIVTADVTMFADEDGKPVYDGKPHIRDGEVVEGTFPFLVAEMRVGRDAAPRPCGTNCTNCDC